MSDSTTTIQAQLNAGGLVLLPAGTFVISNPNPNVDAFALQIRHDNTILRGAGEGLTVIQLAPGQSKWTRMLDITGRANVKVESLTLDGNWPNQPGYPSGNDSEQQHGIFANGSTDVTVREVAFANCAGDGVYWFGNCVNPLVDCCSFTAMARCGIHAQYVTDGIISHSHFSNSLGNNHVKAEIDNEGECSHGLVVTENTFDGNANAFGVQLSGLSANTPYTAVTIADNVFQNLLWAISIGEYAHQWSIADNTISDCGTGIASSTYSTQYGYAGTQGITIADNVVTGANNIAIGLANCTRATVSGNTAQTANPGGYVYDFRHCQNLRLDGVGEQTSARGGGALFYRCKDAAADGLQIAFPNGGVVGLSCQDDIIYPSSGLSYPNMRVSGPQPPTAVVDTTIAHGT